MNSHINRKFLMRPFHRMAVDWFIFKNNQITFFLCFTFTPKIGVGLSKTVGSFYCMDIFIKGDTKEGEILPFKFTKKVSRWQTCMMPVGALFDCKTSFFQKSRLF